MIREEEDIVRQLHEYNDEQLTFWQKVAENVASFWGSRAFIITFSVIVLLWITSNIILLSNRWFDPYPFILLNLLLSCIAALQAPVIMMSQNRQEARDRQRTENDYMVNLKAAVEIRSLHQKLDVLLTEEMSSLYASQKKQGELLQKILEILRKNWHATATVTSRRAATSAKSLHQTASDLSIW